MTKKNPSVLQNKWLLLFIVFIGVLVLFTFTKKNTPLKPSEGTTDTVKITNEAAISQVKALPDVIDYLKRVPNGLVLVNGEEDNTYMVQVYEFKDSHTATFNWYNVDKTTGEIEKQF